MSEIVKLEEVLSPYLHLLQDIKKALGYELIVEEQRPDATRPQSSHFMLDEFSHFWIHPHSINYWNYHKDHYRVCLTVIDKEVNWYGDSDVHKDDVIDVCRELLNKHYYKKDNEQMSLF